MSSLVTLLACFVLGRVFWVLLLLLEMVECVIRNGAELNLTERVSSQVRLLRRRVEERHGIESIINAVNYLSTSYILYFF